jgi:hypothetical protein
MIRRSALRLASLGLLGAWTSAARALIVGDPPDAPEKRIDPNTARSPWSGVGSLTSSAGVFGATLIHRRYAITAGHVAPVDPGEIRLNLNLGGAQPYVCTIKRTVHHPQFHGFDPRAPAFDLALLELEVPAPAAARSYEIYDGPLVPGVEVTLVGYGASGYGAVGITVPAHAATRRVGRAHIERLIAFSESNALPVLYAFPFRRPEKSELLAPGFPTGLASGDSGSACFVRAGRRIQLLGVNTFTSRPPGASGPAFGYGTVGGGQILQAHVKWLDGAMQKS